MPCRFLCDVSEHEVVTVARRAGIDLLGLSALYASPPPQGGILMGFAAYAPHEMEAAVKKLAQVFQTLCS